MKQLARLREAIRFARFRVEWAASARLRRLYNAEPHRLVLDQFRGRIAGGPFKGMAYLHQSAGSTLAAKVLGTYEREIASVIAAVPGQKYETIIDIGAAEGYYAVGLACLLEESGTSVLAFDTDSQARALTIRLAEINGVADRVIVRCHCDKDTLQAHAGKRVFLICDIEGAEMELLDPTVAPALYGFDMIVEVHDPSGETRISDTLQERFAGSHEIIILSADSRDNEPLANTLWVGEPDLVSRILDERRQRGLRWFWMTSRQPFFSECEVVSLPVGGRK